MRFAMGGVRLQAYKKETPNKHGFSRSGDVFTAAAKADIRNSFDRHA